MKNIFKSSMLAVMLVAAVSCEDDNNAIARAEGGPVLLTPESGTELVLSPDNADLVATTFVWDHADYSVGTEVNYSLQMALEGNSFTDVASTAVTTNRFFPITVAALNQLAFDAGANPYEATSIEVRVKSTLGVGEVIEQYSEPISLMITTYSDELPKIAVPGNHQGWSPATAPLIAASAFGASDYEGYMWLDGEYKFLSPQADGTFDWGTPDWGDDGSFSGVLALEGEENASATAGYYRVRMDTEELTYSASPVNWGIIGDATPGGWDTDTDLVYNPDTQKLEIASIALVPGPFKFRGNDAWSNGFDFGTVNEDGFLVEGGDLTFAGPAGDYKVILDLSNPRKYTYQLIQL